MQLGSPGACISASFIDKTTSIVSCDVVEISITHSWRFTLASTLVTVASLSKREPDQNQLDLVPVHMV